MRRAVVVMLAVVLCLSAVALGGCYRRELPENQKIDLGGADFDDGAVIADNPSVPLGEAETLEASVRMGFGQLALESGGSDALDADFTYSPASLKPEVDYEVSSDGEGQLRVAQPDFQPGMFSNTKNEWDLRLAEGVPLDLTVELGAGEGDLKFGGLGLRTLTMNMGAGEATLDFSGDWEEDVDGQIQAGVGQLTLKFPADVGVRVDTHKAGIGDFIADSGFTEDDGVYVNAAYGETAPTIEVSLQRGIGEVRLETVR